MHPVNSLPQTGSVSEVGVRHYVEILSRHRFAFALTFLFVVLVGTVASAVTRPVYEVGFTFQVPELAALPSGTRGPAANEAGAGTGDALVAEHLLTLRSAAFLKAALREAGVRPRPGIAVPSIEATADLETGWTHVTVKGANPVDISVLANTVPALSVRWLTDARQERLRTLLEEAQTEHSKARMKFSEAEKTLLGFRAAHPVAQITSEGEAAERERVQLQTALRAKAMEIRTLRAQITVLRARVAKEPLESILESTSPNRRHGVLKEQLVTLEAQRLRMLKDFRPASDEIRALDAEMEALKAQLDAEPALENEITHAPNPRRISLETKLTDIEASLEAAIAEHAALRQIPMPAGGVERTVIDKWEMDQKRLTQEYEVAQASYTEADRRLRALAQDAQAQRVPEVTFPKVSPPAEPVTPRRKRDLVVAVALGLMLGLGAVFLLAYLDDRVHSPEDVERVSSLPALAYVPRIAAKVPQCLSLLPSDSPISEAYRALRSSIGFAEFDGRIRRLLVTSATDGEGKTLTAVNLAMAMAVAGRRVVLVDTDLRRPGVQRRLELPDGPGLTELLSGEVGEAAVLQSTQITNLQVICAGRSSAVAAELLESPRFLQLLERLGERFDVVVLDSPPCLAVVDPAIVAAEADGVLLVVRAGQTRVEEVASAEHLLNQARARILGIVYNGVEGAGRVYHRRYRYAAAPAGKPMSRRKDPEVRGGVGCLDRQERLVPATRVAALAPDARGDGGS